MLPVAIRNGFGSIGCRRDPFGAELLLPRQRRRRRRFVAGALELEPGMAQDGFFKNVVAFEECFRWSAERRHPLD